MIHIDYEDIKTIGWYNDREEILSYMDTTYKDTITNVEGLNFETLVNLMDNESDKA